MPANKFKDYFNYYNGDANKSSYEIREELVNSPEHYTKGDIECIDAMEAMLTKEEFVGFLRGNSFKYRWRFKYKDTPTQDLMKAKYYEDKLLEIHRKSEVTTSDGSQSGTDC